MPSVGDYLYTSTTAGKAQTSATRAAGAVGRIISMDGTEITTVLWWGVPDPTAAAALIVQEDDVNVDTAVGTIDFRTALNVTSSPAGEANVSVDLGTASTQAAAGDHTHTASDSSKASATSDLAATTTTAADVTGATLSLIAGTYIVIGNFDVTIQTDTDRLFEGILDVGGTDENDLAVLLGVGLDTSDRQQVVQVWRVVLGSTTTVKLQARHSGGTAGDFAVNAANTTLAAFVAGGVPAADAKYVTAAAHAGLSAEIVIPGLASSPDIRVAGTNDDEFDTTDTGNPPAGWTAVGTLNAVDIHSTALSHLYMKANAAASKSLKGLIKTAPAMPFTVTAKLSDCTSAGAFNGAGIIVGVATPGVMVNVGVIYSSGEWRVFVDKFTSPTASTAVVGVRGVASGKPPIYLRIIATSSTSLAFYYSANGYIWNTLTTGYNPSATIATAGLYVNSESASFASEAVFDWIRFT